MNCKPGDLAILLRGRLGTMYSGAIVKVGPEAWPDRGDGPEWTIWFSRSVNLMDGTRGIRAAAPDAWLRPIRDPGDDAVDESKAWLPPVPLPTIDPEMIPMKEKA